MDQLEESREFVALRRMVSRGKDAGDPTADLLENRAHGGRLAEVEAFSSP
jgi:hypothetical protein